MTKNYRPNLNKLCERAEKALEKHPAGDSRALPEHDAQKLAHKLSLHQTCAPHARAQATLSFVDPALA